MPDCKMCLESGWFLRVSSYGLCQKCTRVYSLQAPNHLRIVNDCLRILQDSKKIEIKLQRFKLLCDHLDSLAQFDELGLPGISVNITKTVGDTTETRKVSPKEFLLERSEQKNWVIVQGLRTIVEEAIAKSEVAATTTGKVNALSKAILEIRRFYSEVSLPKELEIMEARLRVLAQKVKLNDIISKAQKAQFKSNLKDALGHYSDALFFLQNEAEASLREEKLAEIETSIAKLKVCPAKIDAQ